MMPKPVLTDERLAAIQTRIDGAVSAYDVMVTPMSSADRVNNTALIDAFESNALDDLKWTLAEVVRLKTQQDEARRLAYRTARIFEPSMDGYVAAMAVYTALFGVHPGEVQIVPPVEGKE